MDDVFSCWGNILTSVHVTSVFMTSELFAKANCLSVQFCGCILGLSLVTLGFVVLYCTLLVLSGLRDSWRGGQRRGCLSFHIQYANIAVFQEELPVYRMAIINFFYRKLKLSSGQLRYVMHLEIFILVPSQQILFTCIALCSFLLLFLAKFKYNRTVL